MNVRPKNPGSLLTRLFAAGIVLCLGWIGWARFGGLIPEMSLAARVEEETVRLREILASRVLDRRIVDVFVRAAPMSDDTGRPSTTIEWRERRPGKDGEHPGDWFEPVVFNVSGSEPRFEALVMRFAAGADTPLAGKALIFFRRAYGEYTAPENAFSFADPENPAPLPYRTETNLPAAERRLWTELWNIATDPAAHDRAEIAAVQTKGVAKPLVPGRLYRIVADDHGMLDISGPFAPSPVFLAEPMPAKLPR